MYPPGLRAVVESLGDPVLHVPTEIRSARLRTDSERLKICEKGGSRTTAVAKDAEFTHPARSR